MQFPDIQALSTALQCQICKEFLSAPVLTACCQHAFCSLCIRHALAETSQCPMCRMTTQPSALRRCPNLQDAVDAFSRVDAWFTAERERRRNAEASAEAEAQRAASAYRVGDCESPLDPSGDVSMNDKSPPCPGMDNGHGQPLESGPSRAVSQKRPNSGSPSGVTPPRNRPRRAAAIAASLAISGTTTSPPASGSRAPPPKEERTAQGEPPDHSNRSSPPLSSIPDSAGSSPSPPPSPPAEISDGLVPCPICSRRMKEVLVFSHLDKCTGSSSAQSSPLLLSPKRKSATAQQPFVPISRAVSRAAAKPPPPPLAQLNYSLLSETALRKKMRELGIPAHGPKQALMRRHSEWVVIYNANCDARHPKSRFELIRQLDAWEKMQGSASSASSSAGPGPRAGLGGTVALLFSAPAPAPAATGPTPDPAGPSSAGPQEGGAPGGDPAAGDSAAGRAASTQAVAMSDWMEAHREQFSELVSSARASVARSKRERSRAAREGAEVAAGTGAAEASTESGTAGSPPQTQSQPAPASRDEIVLD